MEIEQELEVATRDRPISFFLKLIPSGGTFFEHVEWEENIKYKFRFAPKLPSICINH